MKILVADDEKEVVDILKEYLEEKGLSADVAFDGKETLNLIKTNNYDIAFIDENMPELSGLEIVEFIKQNNLNVKTVILTGYPAIDESISRAVGADEFLEKPVNLDQIAKIIEKFRKKQKEEENGGTEC